MRKYIASFILLFAAAAAFAQTRSEAFERAMDLFFHGEYFEASEQFDRLARENDDVTARGYAILCRISLRSGGFEKEMKAYLEDYPALPVSYRIILQYAFNRFDEEDYATALRYFNQLRLDNIDKSLYPEFTFKKAYCSFELEDYDTAREGFTRVLDLPRSDYQAPARFALGYIAYQEKDFKKAFNEFSKARPDPRFTSNCDYYMMECRFMTGDYDYVVEHADAAFDSVSEERKPRLARMLSEIYLVWQEPEKAQAYYDTYLVKGEPRTRKDYFYAGSLLYAVEDYEGAVEKFAGMKYRGDSLGQIASYQMADSYIRLKNKVAAMDAFKEASSVEHDPAITEDAFFNYAKLAFDLNKDGSGFRDYLEKYGSQKRGEQIYSYMALAYLQDKNYAAAIEYYDKIDDFDAQQRENYMKANYLRGTQLLMDGSCRAAVDPFRWAASYAEKGTPIYQYSNYYLAQAWYRDGQYEKARKLYAELYNTSALTDTPEQSMILYALGYCCLREGNYEQADKWFEKYTKAPDAKYRKGAIVRRGDCAFVQTRYKAALDFYNRAIESDTNVDDIYPRYQAGLCYGLLGDKHGRIDALVPVMNASPQSLYDCEALYELGRAYVDADRENGATSAFKMVVDKGRDSTYVAKSLLALGMIARNAGRSDEALTYYKRVVEELPLSGSAADAMAAIEAIYQEKGESAAYLAYLDRIGQGASKTQAEKERIVFNSAEQLFLSGNWERAIASLQAFKQEYPASTMTAKADFYLAESYRGQGEKERARDYYSQVVELADTTFSETSMLRFAELSYSMQQYDEAYGDYRALVQTARFDDNR